jgi:ribbon-helix-helix CopG family protein
LRRPTKPRCGSARGPRPALKRGIWPLIPEDQAVAFLNPEKPIRLDRESEQAFLRPVIATPPWVTFAPRGMRLAPTRTGRDFSRQDAIRWIPEESIRARRGVRIAAVRHPRVGPHRCTPRTLSSGVTARLPPGLVREIEAHAKRTGTTRSDAIREALAIGMETIRTREGVPNRRVDEILGALEGIRAAVDLLGPPTLGTQRLLAHWAARDGSVKVSEDELLAEVRVVGADEWEQAVTEAERDLPEPSNRPAERED